LENLPRPGESSSLPEKLRDRVLQLTFTAPPTQFGATHWPSRLLDTALAAEGTPISHVTVARIWQRFGVQPWRAETFKFSPIRSSKARSATSSAAIASAGEGDRALRGREAADPGAGTRRPAPSRPTRTPGAGSFDYVRHGATALVAALEVATGRVTDACTERHRHLGFVAFLQQVAAAYPRRELLARPRPRHPLPSTHQRHRRRTRPHVNAARNEVRTSVRDQHPDYEDRVADYCSYDGVIAPF
jgi:hypothetical protein